MSIKRVITIFLSIFFLFSISSCKKVDNNVGRDGISPASPKKKNNLPSKSYPKFETTNESVKLKYKFKLGQEVKIIHFLKMNVKYDMILSEIDTKLYGSYKIIEKLPNNQYKLVWNINRIVASFKSGEKKLNYDSNLSSKENTLTNTNVLTNLLKAKIKVNLDEMGNLNNIDLKKILDTMGDDKRSLLFKKELESKSEQLVSNSFIILPKKGIKIGETYDGRAGLKDSSILEISSKKKYFVKAVSKDKKLIVLTPKIEFKINNSSEKQKIKVKRNNVDGWLLFDNEKGQLIESYTHTTLNMIINDVKMNMDMKSNFKIVD